MSNIVPDKTLTDLGRRELNLREYRVDEALPEFIVSEYPKLVTFLENYYNFENTDQSPSRLIDELFNTRDITKADISLLQFIEDELLLGQSYFQGFPDKRSAAKFSNTLYRSKGTKYSIQQFFRMFFNIDPDIIYTKEQIFNVGESLIGPESQRYITNAELYQQFAILIKSELPLSKWEQVYKLFVHPAGMFLGSEVQIVTVVDLDIENQPEPGTPEAVSKRVEGFATLEPAAFAQHTALFDLAERPGMQFRTGLGSRGTYPNPSGNDILDVSDLTLQSIDNQYSSIAEYLEPNSPTLDEGDSGDVTGLDISSEERIDQDQFTFVEPFTFADSASPGPLNDSDGELTLEELLNQNQVN
jgi:hypothetical protein